MLNTPSQVRRYKKEVFDQIQKDPFQSAIHSLCKNLKDNNFKTDDIRLVNEVDESFTAIRIKAEKQLKKKPFSHFAPWSPKMHLSYFNNQYWLSQYRSRFLREDHFDRIKCILKYIDSPSLPHTIEDQEKEIMIVN